MPRPSFAARLIFFAALCAWIAWQDAFSVWHTSVFQLGRGDASNAGFNTIVYLGTYLSGVLGIAALLLHPWKGLRIAACLWFGACAALHAGFEAINGHGFGHHEAALLWSEFQFAPSALRFFAPQLVVPLTVAVCITAALLWIGAKLAFSRGGFVLLLLPLVSAYSAFQLTHQTFGKVTQLPIAVRVPALVQWTYSHRTPYYGRRDAPQVQPSEPALTDHIVLIVDESISAHWLGVNGARPDSTPWLSAKPRGVYNYGIASAISNLSSTSNLLLQAGLRPDQLPDRELRALRSANLFDHLAAAGSFTAFIDAQSYSRRPPNMMTQFDLEGIDAHLQIRTLEPALAEHEIDRASLPRIAEVIGRAPKSFSYVLKNGAHVPYTDKAPPARGAIGPVEASDVLREYLAAIEWSSDAYLKELAALLGESGEEVLVIYTSDHGQSLEEPGSTETVSPHATELSPPSAQASVPLILMAFGDATRAAIDARFRSELHDRASAFEIFPTILEAAGFAREDLRAHFAPSLFDPQPRGERIFASGNVFAREGGFYVLNPGMGSVCLLNRFEPPEPRSFPPAAPDATAGTKEPADTGTGTSPTESATSST